jgi:tetratricopeptide (TPR) repeat protein
LDGRKDLDLETLVMLFWTAARLQALMGRLEEAAEWIRRALSQPLDEYHRIAPLVELGNILRHSGRNQEAKQVLQEALQSALRRSGRENPRIYYELGLVERSLGRPNDAKAHFEKALQIITSDSLLQSDREYIKTLYLEIAEICYDLGDRRAEAQRSIAMFLLFFHKSIRPIGRSNCR